MVLLERGISGGGSGGGSDCNPLRCQPWLRQDNLQISQHPRPQSTMHRLGVRNNEPQIETPQSYLGLRGCPRRGAAPALSSTSQMSDTDILTINCWIQGDRYSCAFQVKIPRNESVDALRVAIKATNPKMKDINAHSLILYKVSIPFSPELAQDVARLGLDGLGLDNPFSKLSVAFDNELLDGYVHVVVQLPLGECLVLYPLTCGLIFSLFAFLYLLILRYRGARCRG